MEILAPAGSKEAFLAAINSGADAVYLAGKNFGARAYAANFETEELAELIRYAHLRGAAVYVTLNTLIADSELQDALRFAADVWQVGADALILQDWGFASLLAEALPEAVQHASTQMTLHNAPGTAFAAANGMARVILAREVSIEDMAAIKSAVDTELEVFVHGALCICFSGQCLFSSLVGGRSGNRGRCAQPCRLKYQLMQDGEVVADGHLLSPRDLLGIEYMDELVAAGVDSLKIEGRMKRPEYVAAATAAYAAAKRGEEYDAKALAQTFNRGFTGAYFADKADGGNAQEPGSDFMSYERPNNRGVRLGRIDAVERDALVLRLSAPLQVGDGIEFWVTKGGRQGCIVKELENLADGRVRLPLSDLPLKVQHLSVGDRVFRTSDSSLNSRLEALCARLDDLELRLHFGAKLGARPELTAEHGEYSVTVSAEHMVAAAKNRPADMELLQRQLGRLGGSGWRLAELTADIESGLMLPASVLNQLRRDALQKLEEKILDDYQCRRQGKAAGEIKSEIKSGIKSDIKQNIKRVSMLSGGDMRDAIGSNKSGGNKNERLAVAVGSLAAARAVCQAGAERIYWRGWADKFDLRAGSGKKGRDAFAEEVRGLAELDVPVAVLLPTVALQKELPLWRERLLMCRDAGITAIAAANPWVWGLLDDMADDVSDNWRPEITADFGLNIFNAASAIFWQRHGVNRVALSRELNREQLKGLRRLLQGRLASEVQVFGELEMMNSRHCPVGALCGGRMVGRMCSGACRGSRWQLRDEKGYCFPVYTDEFCRSHILNGHQLCLLEEAADIAAGGQTARLELLHWEARAAAKATDIYADLLFGGKLTEAECESARQKLAALAGVSLTKGHYHRGVE